MKLKQRNINESWPSQGPQWKEQSVERKQKLTSFILSTAISLNPTISLATNNFDCQKKLQVNRDACVTALEEFGKRCNEEQEEIVTQCDQALRSLMTLANKQNLQVQQAEEFISIQEAELQRRADVMKMLEEENNAWYKNPYNMILLGIAAGAVGAATIGR